MIIQGREKNKLVKDSVFLYGLAAANLLLPIMFIPYASSKLGIERFGMFAVFASFLQYGLLVVEFGTTTPLVRYLPSANDLKTYWSVIAFRVLLALFVFCTESVFFCFFYTEFDFVCLIISFFSLIGIALNPISIFQSRNMLPIFSGITFAVRFAITLSAFFLLKYIDKIWVVLYFQFFSSFVVSVVSLYFLSFKDGLNFTFNLSFFKNKQLKSESISFFMGTVFCSGYTIAIPLIINAFFGGYLAGVYGIIDRVVQPIKQIMMPLINVLYPRICVFVSENKNTAINFSLKYSLFLCIGCSIGLVFCCFFSNYISIYIFKGLVDEVFLYPTIFNVFFVYLSQVLLFLFVVPYGKSVLLKKIYAFMLFVFFVCMLFSVFVKNIMVLYWSLALVEFIGVFVFFILSLLCVVKYKINVK